MEERTNWQNPMEFSIYVWYHLPLGVCVQLAGPKLNRCKFYSDTANTQQEPDVLAVGIHRTWEFLNIDRLLHSKR